MSNEENALPAASGAEKSCCCGSRGSQPAAHEHASHAHGSCGHGHGGCGGHGRHHGGHGGGHRHESATAEAAAPIEAASQETAPKAKEILGAPLPEGVTFCNFDDFAKIRLTVAEIIHAEPHPKADKLIKLQIRLGDREKQICAGIRAFYQPEELVGKRIVVVDNLEPRKLRGEMSNGMLLAAHGPDDTISLVTLDKPDFPSGGQVS